MATLKKHMTNESSQQKLRSVKEAMSTNVLTVGPNTTVARAAKLMARRGVGSVVIVESKKPVGILTRVDFKRLGQRFSRAPVRRIMSSPFFTVALDTDITEAARIMARNRIRTLPVIAHGELIGIVTARDIPPTVGPSREEIDELKKQIEQQEAELGKYRQMEKGYLELQQRYEKLSQEKAELEAMCAREDLKNLKEALWAADGYLDRLKRDLKEGRISEKEHEVRSKQLLKDKWDVQHRMLILEDMLEKAVAKSELVVASRETQVKGLKLVKEKKALPKEKAEKQERKAMPE
ncbi:Inosine-5'-monophosphate dehydrogenase [subsurface metagenome]